MQQPDFIPFSRPEIGEEEIQEVVNCLRSGWLTTGPKTVQFESDFAKYINAALPDEAPRRQAVAINSATAGLHLALEALGIGPGDEVVVPTHTFTATAEVIRYLGADPVFVDVDPAMLNIDVAQVEAALTSRTKAIMPVHFAGLAAEMTPLIALAKRHGLAIVEDAAHAFPSKYRGQLIGTLDTTATVFSFYANKTMTTGEGGMLVSSDPKLIERAKTMRLHGINRDVYDRFSAKVPSWYYEVVAPGYKYNLTDVASAMGIHQLQKAEGFRNRRVEIVTKYDAGFADLPAILPAHGREGDVNSWHLYVFRLAAGAPLTRDQLVNALFDNGVGCSVHYIPLHQQPYWRDTYKLDAAAFPVSQAAYDSMVSLPLYSSMSDAQVDRVIEVVRKTLAA